MNFICKIFGHKPKWVMWKQQLSDDKCRSLHKYNRKECDRCGIVISKIAFN